MKYQAIFTVIGFLIGVWFWWMTGNPIFKRDFPTALLCILLFAVSGLGWSVGNIVKHNKYMKQKYG